VKRLLLLAALIAACGPAGPKCLESRRVVDEPAGWRVDCGYGFINGKWQVSCGAGLFPSEKVHYECVRYAPARENE
jgi:hypothetical protein